MGTTGSTVDKIRPSPSGLFDDINGAFWDHFHKHYKKQIAYVIAWVIYFGTTIAVSYHSMSYTGSHSSNSFTTGFRRASFNYHPSHYPTDAFFNVQSRFPTPSSTVRRNIETVPSSPSIWAESLCNDGEDDGDIKAEDDGGESNDEHDQDQPPKKKRQPWGRKLTPPTTNLPPRKRAKTEAEKEQRRYERIIRNRKAAETSRKRKQEEQEKLHHEVDRLRVEQELLHQEIAAREALLQSYRKFLLQFCDTIEKATGQRPALPWEPTVMDVEDQKPFSLKPEYQWPTEGTENFVSPLVLEHESPELSHTDDCPLAKVSKDTPIFADTPATDTSFEHENSFPQTPDNLPIFGLDSIDLDTDFLKINNNVPLLNDSLLDDLVTSVDQLSVPKMVDAETMFEQALAQILDEEYRRHD